VNLTLSSYSLAPVWPESDDEQPGYGLFVEQGDLPGVRAGEELARRLDEALCQTNIEYESKRSSGRLAPVRLELVPTGFWARWDRERLQRTGGTLEQYKHACLIGDMDFSRSTARVGVGS